MKRDRLALGATLALVALPATAHHGVAGLGAASLEGPGAPLEQSSSATLPKGKVFTYFKVDDADWKTYTPETDDEAESSTFWMAGLGYGVTPWLSLYAFLPYHDKVDENDDFNTHGWADAAINATIGFKYDDGFKLVPEKESLDDLEDWHFTVYAGVTLPTGNPNLRDRDGNIDKGKSTGFGEPTFTLGATASKMLGERWTLNFDISNLWFQQNTYDADPAHGDDKFTGQFGDEFRLNTAAIYKAYVNPERRFRLDLLAELNYLNLGRDKEDGVAERGTGGQILYLTPGVRAYWNNVSFAFGVKLPIATDLNEDAEQQGAEGKENYRLVFSISALF
ncbi:transporter [Allochromatium palmeri]|uniref:Transporter n=1 Tax=Allochromatium palmeri TaxID=231048 RepID=A0A6N8EIY2_9GAMM|nr:transporter [Allochromatium palmeri]MTW22284.1 transporter [Allochromatium palmeri]